MLNRDARQAILGHLDLGGVLVRVGNRIMAGDGDREGHLALKRYWPEIVASIRPPIGIEEAGRAGAILAGQGIGVVKVETVDGVGNAMVELQAHVAAYGGPVGLDTETAASPRPVILRINKDGTPSKLQPKQALDTLDPFRSHIRMLQLYAGGDRAYVIDAHKVLFDRAAFRDAIDPLLDLPLVMHNAVFDLRFLLLAGLEPRAAVHDTMSACLLTEGLSYGVGLDKTIERLFERPISKEFQSIDWNDDTLPDGAIDYAALDAVLVRAVFRRQRNEMRRLDARYQRDDGPSLEAAQALVDSVLLPTARAINTGVGFDRKAHQEELASWATGLAAAEAALATVVPDHDIRNPRQLRAYLETVLTPSEIEAWPRTEKTKVLSTRRGDIGLRSDVKGIAELMDVKQYEKLISTFGVTLADTVSIVTGRIHTSLRPAAAKSGRFSASRPNLQQIPSRSAATLRRTFRASPGRVLLSADYSQIELRVLAELVAIEFGESTMLDAFMRGVDAHRNTALFLSGDAEPTDDQRTRAKAMNFGLIYGSGSKGFNIYVRNSAPALRDLSIEETDEMRAMWFAAYPDIRAYQERQKLRCKKRGYVTTLGGRRWHFKFEAKAVPEEESWEDRPYEFRGNLALNHVVQGTAAEIMQIAIANLDRRLAGDRDKAAIVLTVHDELVLEIADNPETVKRVIEAVRSVMADAYFRVFADSCMPPDSLVEIKVGPTWAKTDLVKWQ